MIEIEKAGAFVGFFFVGVVFFEEFIDFLKKLNFGLEKLVN